MAEAAKKIEGKAGSGNGLMILIVVLLILLLAGVGGLGYYLFTSAHNSSNTALPVGRAQTMNALPIFQKLDTFIVNLSGGSGATMLQVDMQVQLADEAAKQQLTEFMPKVRSAVILLLSSKTADELATTEGKMRLKNQVQQVINEALGAGGSPVVYSVMFTSFIIQSQ